MVSLTVFRVMASSTTKREDPFLPWDPPALSIRLGGNNACRGEVHIIKRVHQERIFGRFNPEVSVHFKARSIMAGLTREADHSIPTVNRSNARLSLRHFPE